MNEYLYFKQKAQSHRDTFRQRGVEMIDRTQSKWSSIKSLLEGFNSLF